ncbi:MULTISPECIES: hypothetical protein [unclassified Enterococcus]|uniref:hypothetical protein n=1 Tax=unclassified Enterococcus TaxID=2608891 RepID=UPI0024759119|nr:MULTISPECIES: hypothetical protein [unclassified Enterococcus]
MSLNFTQTIKSKSYEELIQLYKHHDIFQEENSFEITRKINQLILFDDSRKRFCLPNHPKYSNENLKPEIFPFSIIGCCTIIEDEEILNEKNKCLGTIKVTIFMKQENPVSRDIYLVKNPIEINSIAFKTMQILARKIKEEIETIQNGVISC